MLSSTLMILKKDVHFTDKYLLLGGQQFLGVNGSNVDKGSLFIGCFDLATGKLVKYFIKPETTYAGHDIVFNKDKTHAYWAHMTLSPTTN